MGYQEFLELEPQPELDLSGIDAEAGNLSEVCITQGGSRVAELRMIPGVEEFGAELDFGIFGGVPAGMTPEPRDIRDFEDGEIPIVDSGAAHEVSTGIAERTQSRLGKSGSIEPLIEGAIGFAQGWIPGDVRALADSKVSQTGIFVLQADVQGAARAEHSDPVHLPSRRKNFHDSIGLATKGKFPNIIEHQGVRNVLVSNRLFPVGVESILYGQETGFTVLVGGRGDVARVGVGGLELQAVRHLAVKEDLQRVVTGSRGTLVHIDEVEAEEGAHSVGVDTSRSRCRDWVRWTAVIHKVS